MKNLTSLLATLLVTVNLASAQQTINTPSEEQTPQTRQMIERNEEFRHEIIQLAENVYTASGYDASNITMIIGDDGVILIDAGKFADNSAEVYAEFRKITDKPITGIIFTHGHGDHTQGVPAFLADNTPQIWAADGFGRENEFPTKAGFINPRGHRQNGMTLSPEVRINNGVAPLVYPGGKFVGGDEQAKQAKAQYVPFNKSVITNFVSEPKQSITISGVTLELEKTYGETNDHLLIYYPEKGIIFPGDQFYKSFPNLYAIRGTEYRDVLKWIEALDTILSYDAEIMAQGHTRPIVGKEAVKEAVTAMRDAIRYTFDKTIEGMNKGLTPDELVEYAALPEPLASHPNLVQYYGRQEWAIRNIFNGYLGWFDGNATSLRPLSPRDQAEKMAQLAGGVEGLSKAARRAFKQGEWQWCAELCDRLIVLEPESREHKLLKADALNALADNIETATARNYYNTSANELRAQ
ncbi:MAG: alkyl/aryl-sulfatase [Rikenellaceae bacterium]